MGKKNKRKTSTRSSISTESLPSSAVSTDTSMLDTTDTSGKSSELGLADVLEECEITPKESAGKENFEVPASEMKKFRQRTALFPPLIPPVIVQPSVAILPPIAIVPPVQPLMVNAKVFVPSRVPPLTPIQSNWIEPPKWANKPPVKDEISKEKIIVSQELIIENQFPIVPIVPIIPIIPVKHAVLEELKVCSFLPKRCEGRPPQENRGRHIIVEANHLKLEFNSKNSFIYHYDVTVEPEKPMRFYREALEIVRKTCYPNNYPSFDGKKNLYSIKKLPVNNDFLNQQIILDDKENGKQREMTVSIKLVSSMNFSSVFKNLSAGKSTIIPPEAIQAIDIVLRQPAARLFCQVGRSYFTPPAQVISLGDGLDLWYGFFQSAINGWKPYLNVDVAHKGFASPTSCLEALSTFLGKFDNQALDPGHFTAFRSYIKRLKIIYAPPKKDGNMYKRTYTVVDLGAPAVENYFEIPDKGKTTVYKYFESEYKYQLKYFNLPTLQCGSQQKPVFLPIELCTIKPGQPVMKKMNEKQTSNMIRAAAVPAYERKKKIENSIRTISFNNDPFIKEFGISVSKDFAKVHARVLEPPTLVYNDQTVRVNNGVWRSGKFLKPAILENWVVYSADNRVNERSLRDTVNKMIFIGREVGMVIKEPTQYRIIKNPRDLERDFMGFKNAQLVFVVMPERGLVTYAKIKQAAELRVGILTQCIKSRTLPKCNSNATVLNILLKVNAKLNGVNHTISSGVWPSFFKRPVMIIGADVTHPSPDQVNVPSVAAVAASYDSKAYCYNMIYRIQQPKEEIIGDLENIMIEQLMFFYKKTNYKPYELLFYRDGVSSGQFKQVLDEEMLAIRRACKKLSKEYEPAITFFVVQKRHHTRLFPGLNDAEGRNKNVPPGTVVDTEIVHPTELDFFLVSHASIQGTSRPTKYHLLWNDSNMSQDDLEELTNYLCHIFTRCTRSVSYPAPTYYAHLAAFRVRSYIDNANINLRQLKNEEEKRTVKSCLTAKNPMFFV